MAASTSETPNRARSASISEMPNRTRGAYLCFSLALLLALGSYQFMALVKQALFFDVVGVSKEPLAQTLVLCILVPVLLLYSLVFSLVEDPKCLVLFVIVCFGLLYVFLAARMASTHDAPGGWIAWALYYVTECHGVILMPMIWSIVNDVTSTEVAKVTYPLIFFFIQLGGVGGSLMAVHVSSLGSVAGLLLAQAALLLATAGLTWGGCALAGRETDEEQLPLVAPLVAAPAAQQALEAPAKGKRQAGPSALFGAVEGLWLLFSRPYVLMTFWVSYAALMPRMVLDYTNGTLVSEAFAELDAQVAFWGRMSLVQNSATAALMLLGTQRVVEALGIGRALLVLPVAIACCVLAVCMHQGLWVSAAALVAANVVTNGLNAPCKEMLYIKTSRKIKYKAKSWSEMYASGLMKVLGAQVSLWLNNENDACRPDCFHRIPTMAIVAAWISVWLAVVMRLDDEYQRLEKRGEVVE